MLALCAVFPVVATAQTLCDNPPTTLVMGPNPTFYVRIPSFNAQEPNGSFQLTDLQYALFAEGVDPSTAAPLQGPSTIDRSAIKLSAAPDCYTFVAPQGIPTSERLGASYKFHRAASAGIAEMFGTYPPLSNPFGAAASAFPAASRLTVR